MDALPLLGEPTSSTRTIRVYVWFALALVLSIVVATLSLLCKFWISGDEFSLLFLGAPRTPQSRFKAFKQCCMTRLMALGPALMYTAITCFGIGLLDLFWQLYPALSVGIATTCGICGSGPILSYLSEGSLSEVPTPARIRRLWRVVLTACISGIARTGYTQQAGTQAETQFN
ncbi:hypothetical protein B0H10DRAFT_2025842 [Mycena sp. CBHHK59/15]|nr:hypothetical protein B0H10DRAFT_2025842 [Mycena sp. CBHHK59/15]